MTGHPNMVECVFNSIMESLRSIFTVVGGAVSLPFTIFSWWGSTDQVELSDHELAHELERAQQEAEEEIARSRAIGDAIARPGRLTEEDEAELDVFMAAEEERDAQGQDGQEAENAEENAEEAEDPADFMAEFVIILSVEELTRALLRKSALFNLATKKIRTCRAILVRLEMDDATRERVQLKIRKLWAVRSRLQSEITHLREDIELFS